MSTTPTASHAVSDSALRAFLRDMHVRLGKARKQIECAPYRHAVGPLAAIEDLESDLARVVGVELDEFCECGAPVFGHDATIFYEDGPAGPCLKCSETYEADAVAKAEDMIRSGLASEAIIQALYENHGHIRDGAWLKTVAAGMKADAA